MESRLTQQILVAAGSPWAYWEAIAHLLTDMVLPIRPLGNAGPMQYSRKFPWTTLVGFDRVLAISPNALAGLGMGITMRGGTFYYSA